MLNIQIKTIPHSKHRYESVGDWREVGRGKTRRQRSGTTTGDVVCASCIAVTDRPERAVLQPRVYVSVLFRQESEKTVAAEKG